MRGECRSVRKQTCGGLRELLCVCMLCVVLIFVLFLFLTNLLQGMHVLDWLRGIGGGGTNGEFCRWSRAILAELTVVTVTMLR